MHGSKILSLSGSFLLGGYVKVMFLYDGLIFIINQIYPFLMRIFYGQYLHDIFVCCACVSFILHSR
jgi:hypothetical protein